MNMFCYQCEQAGKGTGCVLSGICGKDPETAALQDLLIHAAQGISQYAHRARKLGVKDHATDVFVTGALFTTVTNVNFDPARLETMLRRAAMIRDEMKARYEAACMKNGAQPEKLAGAAEWQPAADLVGLVMQGHELILTNRKDLLGADVAGLQDLLLFGVKGTAAYADHALILGKEDDSIFAFFHDALNYLTLPNPQVGELLGWNLKCGEVNLKVMELLDAANTGSYGNPVPTPVRMTAVKGKAILVSGHDLKDLAELLKQTEGKGINIYTHGEMLPAHGYPELKKFKHLAGNYGGAWQDQQKEFADFPGAILMTTNCIQEPRNGYKARIFTSGLVAWPGVPHIADGNFKPVIDAALAAPGFTADEPEKLTLVGFGHHAVLGVADKVIDAVKTGAIKRFFLIGGCDGAKPGRNYYPNSPRPCRRIA